MIISSLWNLPNSLENKTLYICSVALRQGKVPSRERERERESSNIKKSKNKKLFFFSITTMPLCCLESIPGFLSRVCSIYALKRVCQIAF